jgi:hypothetical protein
MARLCFKNTILTIFAISTPLRRTAIQFQPAFSMSERRFFVGTTTAILFCINTETGDILWSVEDLRPLSNKAIISPDDIYVYVTRENGLVAAYDQTTGEESWNITCADLEDPVESDGLLTESFQRVAASCVDLIEAEASISPTGTVLYFGDKYGNVKAIQLGNSTEPTDAPTEFPTFPITDAPSESLQPTRLPTAGFNPSLRPSLSPHAWTELLTPSSSAPPVALSKASVTSGAIESCKISTTTILMLSTTPILLNLVLGGILFF